MQAPEPPLHISVSSYLLPGCLQLPLRVVRVGSGAAISELPQARPTTVPSSSSGLEDSPYPRHSPATRATPSYWPCLFALRVAPSQGWMDDF